MAMGKLEVAFENTRPSCFQQATCRMILFSAAQRMPAKFENVRRENPLVRRDNRALKLAIPDECLAHEALPSLGSVGSTDLYV